jgi:hypothetical protein
VIRQSATGSRTATLGTQQQNAIVKTRFRFLTFPSSSWQAVHLLVRVGSPGDWYCVRVRTVAGAADDIEIDRSTTAGGIVRVGTGAVVPEVVAGAWYWLALDVRGEGTATSLRARLWRDGTSEPTGWNATASDGTAMLQGPGGVGVRVSSTSTSSPANVEVDDFTASSTE